jgi:hypothetical protein
VNGMSHMRPKGPSRVRIATDSIRPVILCRERRGSICIMAPARVQRRFRRQQQRLVDTNMILRTLSACRHDSRPRLKGTNRDLGLQVRRTLLNVDSLGRGRYRALSPVRRELVRSRQMSLLSQQQLGPVAFAMAAPGDRLPGWAGRGHSTPSHQVVLIEQCAYRLSQSRLS